MKPQFRASTMLLVVAAFAITFIGAACWRFNLQSHATIPLTITWYMLVAGTLGWSPIWLPIAFAAYAFGRRKFTVAMILTFAALEVAAVAIQYGTIALGHRL